MLIAQISDLHIKPRGTLLFGAVDAYAMAEALVSRLNALRPRPDGVAVTGDLTNDGTEDDFAAAVGPLERIEAPVYPIIGNHDRRESARRALAPIRPMPDEGPLCYAADAGALRIVALDSLIEGEDGGAAGEGQLEWLDETLGTAPDRPTLVLIHHPPFATGIAFMDAIGLNDADALAGVIVRHRQVVRVLAGHVHRSIQTAFAGTIAVTAPGAAHQVVLDLEPGAPSAWTSEPPGFLLHRWDGRHLVSHLAFTDPGGPARGFTDDHTTGS